MGARVDNRIGLAVLVVGYALLGALSVWLPWRLALDAGRTKAGNPIDGLQVVSLGLLVVVGAIGGGVAPRRSPWLAMTTMAAFPLLAFVDMARDATSHNLWPMEFVAYGVESLLAVAGAAIVASIRRRAARAEGAEPSSL